MPAETLAFIYGKMPSHGDFVSRGVDPVVRELWDEWLVREMTFARKTHGAAFDGLYARAPTWRFAIAEGDKQMAGTLACSVDSVGRRFPLLVGRYAGSASAALAEACEDRLYAAFTGGWTADQLHAALDSVQVSGEPTDFGWWTAGNAGFAPTSIGGVLPDRLISTMLIPEPSA